MCGVYTILSNTFCIYLFLFIYAKLKNASKIVWSDERLGQRNMIERERRETARDERVERPLREFINEVLNVMGPLLI